MNEKLKNKSRWSWTVLIIVLGLVSVGIVRSVGISHRVPDISLKDGEAVLSPVMIGVESVYMDIINNGGADELISVKTSFPKSIVILHDVQDGRMVQKDRISVPAGASISLRPGGLHIMLFNMPPTLKEGDVITLHLVFAKSGERQVQAGVIREHQR